MCSSADNVNIRFTRGDYLYKSQIKITENIIEGTADRWFEYAMSSLRDVEFSRQLRANSGWVFYTGLDDNDVTIQFNFILGDQQPRFPFDCFSLLTPLRNALDTLSGGGEQVRRLLHFAMSAQVLQGNAVIITVDLYHDQAEHADTIQGPKMEFDYSVFPRRPMEPEMAAKLWTRLLNAFVNLPQQQPIGAIPDTIFTESFYTVSLKQQVGKIPDHLHWHDLVDVLVGIESRWRDSGPLLTFRGSLRELKGQESLALLQVYPENHPLDPGHLQLSLGTTNDDMPMQVESWEGHN